MADREYWPARSSELPGRELGSFAVPARPRRPAAMRTSLDSAVTVSSGMLTNAAAARAEAPNRARARRARGCNLKIYGGRG